MWGEKLDQVLLAGLVNSYIKRKKFEAGIIAQVLFGSTKDSSAGGASSSGAREVSTDAMLARIA